MSSAVSNSRRVRCRQKSHSASVVCHPCRAAVAEGSQGCWAGTALLAGLSRQLVALAMTSLLLAALLGAHSSSTAMQVAVPMR